MFYGSQIEIKRLAQAERIWLFLDYDGTLAGFAPTPDDILPDPAVIDLLTRLQQQPDIRVAVVSGRRLEHIRALLPAPGILLAGTYGIEYLSESGEQINRLDYAAIRPFLDKLKPQWAALIAGHQGYYLEDKGWTLAIHARHAKDHEARQLLVKAGQTGMAELPAHIFHLLGGDKFLEIGPQIADKGQTIDYLLDKYPWQGALPVYVGDDDKDEKAFARINLRGGISILVSETDRQTHSMLRLKSPASVLRWLRGLTKATN